MIPTNTSAVVSLNDSILSASFTSIDFLVELNEIKINYKSNDKNYLESSLYSQNYSIINSFSESNYDFTNFMVNNLYFNNNFAESAITDLAYIKDSRINNNFGELTIFTGNIIGEKEVLINNNFGDVILTIDKDASYSIESDNSFGSIKNNIGLLSSDYINASNKIKIIIENSFGTVELFKQ